MDRFDRIFELNRILQNARHPVSRRRLEEELECSRATVKRIIEDMRLYLNAPIVYDRDLNGYRYDQSEGEMYELPGLWFNASELHALITVQQLLADVQPGLLEPMLKPLQQRIDSLLELQQAGSEGLQGRIRVLQMAARRSGDAFQTVAGALAKRTRLRIRYFTRSRESRERRDVSPQRLVHYRDNWYLDGWCHLRDGLRTFSIDAIETASPLDEPALEVCREELETHFTSSYGIFSGAPEHEAVLLFTPERARYVASECWHRDQQGRTLDDGRYELRVPYSNPAELVMDILKYGPDVEVVAPGELRRAVARRLAQAAALYGRPEAEGESA
ncbi:MAG: WYL domain-containing protein [Thiohalocapsa sp.]|nr:WYL domain-containing protein [Thiohalocapsa sp.]MCF7991121.1 WYL domain-containing protein [Thiohalocapsa sp.]